MRVARSRELVARGFAVAAVARVLQISRQALYRTPTPRKAPQRRPPADPVEAAIVEEAVANQTDGYRMVTAFVRRRLGRPVNRKRVLRVMRERKLIQRRRPLERRKRPGFFRVERPRQLWQLDMTSVWVAEQGWTYLLAMIDCCTREIVDWQLSLRCRADEAIAVVDRAVAAYAIEPGELVLGSDNGAAFTARRFRQRLAELDVRHRRGGYRDPESQAFIESWFGKLKEREVWLNEYETLDNARRGIGGYVDPTTSGPTAGSTTGHPWRCAGPGRINSNYKNRRPSLSTPAGSTSGSRWSQKSVGQGPRLLVAPASSPLGRQRGAVYCPFSWLPPMPRLTAMSTMRPRALLRCPTPQSVLVAVRAVIVAPAASVASDLKDPRVAFVLDGGRRGRKRGKDSEHLLADVRESVARAGRNEEALARSELGLLLVDEEPGPPLQYGYHFLDSVVAVRRSAGPRVTQLLDDAEMLGAGRRGRMQARSHARSPFDKRLVAG